LFKTATCNADVLHDNISYTC